MKNILTAISLGAGVQSSTMALMAAKGELPMPDCAIFADTGYEPDHIYTYLKFLTSVLPFPVYTVDNGNLRDDMVESVHTGARFASVPFFTKNETTGKIGILKRQCTYDYKIEPIRVKLRRLCGVNKHKQFPKNSYVEQWIGISTDEAERIKPSVFKYIKNIYPLIELNMSREDCFSWLETNKYPLPQKSSCLCCPFHSDKHWHDMQKNTPAEFKEAVWIDKKIRSGTKNAKGTLYLHKSCKPLDEINFDKNQSQRDTFGNECEGMCGL